ncbi:signal peptidase II [Periweissella cryptocerci]|uniref:Lipoprotein signal peptidase n=1 Tax=Periweissella cryptocerci TaxID=2506420 RepID=A0A4P6YWM0_9LACO|nr:signal peptidase II [Periweissella cryptocerci]QBO37191.1 signal peptidase II [Periweissella cryptocerci]
MKKKYLVRDIIIAIIVLIGDQLLKVWIQGTQLGVHGQTLVEQKLIPGVISLTKLHNDGAAWSVMSGRMWFFYVVSAIAIIVLVYIYRQTYGHRWFNISLALMIAGTLGNLIDRVRQGFVVDMFDLQFINFPIFNIADVALTVGVIGLFIGILTDREMQ